MLRFLTIFMLLTSVSYGDGYDPLGLTPPATAETRCITVDGVDYDLDTILAEYNTTWTWPKLDGSHGGDDEASLRKHLSDPRHKVTGIENLDFETLKKVHSVLHAREEAVEASKLKAVPKATPALPKTVQGTPRGSGPCPGGVCPAPQRYYRPQKPKRFSGRLFGG